MSNKPITADEAWATYAEAARARSEARVAENTAWMALEDKLRRHPGAPYDAELAAWQAAQSEVNVRVVESTRSFGIYLAAH